MAPSKEEIVKQDWHVASRRWLNTGEDLILIAVAVLLLIGGLFIVIDAVGSLVAALAGDTRTQVIFGVAETALLALILAELVHSLLMSLDGRGLTPEPFLVIAIVAILRKMLLTTVQIAPTPDSQTTTLVVGELLALSLIILALAVALVIIARSRKGPPEREA